MTIYYSYDVYDASGALITPPPTFITVDLVLRKVKVVTNSFGDAGLYNITIFGHILGFKFTTP